MSWRTLILAGCVFAGVAIGQTPPLANEELLRSARVWEARDRGDLARLALEKLVAARPDLPGALVELGELHLRMADIAAAQNVQQQLDARFPNSPESRTFAAELRFATRDRLQLASVERLIQLNRGADARAELTKLFPDGPPGGTLGIDYFRLLASTPGGWERAQEGLRRLAARHDDDPRYRFALARLLLRREATELEGLRMLDALTQRDDTRARDVDEPLAGALREMGYRRAPLDILRRYASRHRDDSEIARLLALRTRIESEQTLVLQDARSAADPERQRRNVLEMQRALLDSPDAAVDAERAIALLRRLRGAPDERASRFSASTEAALSWAQRSRQSARTDTELAAIETDIAVAFARGTVETVIGLVERLEPKTSTADADRLLAQAAALDPGSTWLFETRVRRLIARGAAADAMQLIDARPLDARWTATTRDELRASALDQLSQTALASGFTSRARADLERAIQLAPAYPWTRFRLAGVLANEGDRAGGAALMDDGARRAPTNPEMRYAQALYLSSIDDTDGALAALRNIAPQDRTENMRALDERLRTQLANRQREQELSEIRTLQREGEYEQAIVRLDALLTASPDDRSLRIARAELELSAGRAQVARDRYAALVAEQPDDLDTRLDYARALVQTDDVDLARLQVETVAEQAPSSDSALQLSLARRRMELGRAALEQRDFIRAREYFTQAERSNDLGVGSDARLAREAIEMRLESWMEAGIEARHKPGDSGVSQSDSLLIPTSWRYANDFDRRFTLRADAVSVDAGRLDADYDVAALLGTIQAAGPAAQRRYRNERDDGLSLGVRYDTDTLSADVGTTPLGFLLTNVVGGIEWAPDWGELDVALGAERRAVTSSVLSYAGMRDPISGREWGGVVETGPYVEAGLYRERYSIAGAARYTQLTGKNIADNTFIGGRAAADWKFWSRPQTRAFVGVTVNLWRYEHNLQNYTFGHGGYYSPESYLSIAVPVELQGSWRDWSYRFRVSLAYSNSDIERSAFYPSDAALQASAATSPLPEGFATPYYTDDGGSGTSLSAYAAVEKQISRNYLIGAKLDIDRADYYEPTIFMVYVRHVFGRAETPLAIPPRPARAYNE